MMKRGIPKAKTRSISVEGVIMLLSLHFLFAMHLEQVSEY